MAVCATRYFQDGTDPQTGTTEDGWPIVDADDPVKWLIDLWAYGPNGHGGMVPLHAWLVPRSLAVDAGPWDERLSLDDDGEYFSRIVLASSGVRRAASGMAYYRKYVRNSNLSAQKSSVYQRSALLSLDQRAKLILSCKDDMRAKCALARCYKERAFNAYPFSIEVSKLALRRARALGDSGSPANFGTKWGRTMAKMFGWRATRRMNILYHRCVSNFEVQFSQYARSGN